MTIPIFLSLSFLMTHQLSSSISLPSTFIGSSPDRILSAPNFYRLIDLIDRHQELVRVISELSQGSCMTKLRQSYCGAVNLLLRKELRSITGGCGWAWGGWWCWGCDCLTVVSLSCSTIWSDCVLCRRAEEGCTARSAEPPV